MYVVAIGWLYVVTLMALAEPTMVAGVLTFVFYGLAPVSLLFWLTGAMGRRAGRRQQRRAPSEAEQGKSARPPESGTNVTRIDG